MTIDRSGHETNAGGNVTHEKRKPTTSFPGGRRGELRTFDRSGNLGIRRFVDPLDGQADVVVSLGFADGSVRTFGLG